MAESTVESSAKSMSLSMKATVYGIQKKFPSVRNISCSELESWRKEKQELVVLVRIWAMINSS